jgi:hypothetical protein
MVILICPVSRDCLERSHKVVVGVHRADAHCGISILDQVARHAPIGGISFAFAR